MTDGSFRREPDTRQMLGVAMGRHARSWPATVVAADFVSLALMSAPTPGDRYGSPNVAMKILWSLVALAMIVLGAIWALTASGAPQSFGPIVAGLGVALGYVVLIQKRP
jgi:hypothetical protein